MSKIIECGVKPVESSDILPRRWLIYGNATVGKTHSLITLPDSMRPALILDFDRGGEELDEHQGLGTRVLFDIEDTTGKPVLCAQARQFVRQFHAGTDATLKMPRKCVEYRTVVCDSLTTFVVGATYESLQWYIDHGEKGTSREDFTAPPALHEYGMLAHVVKKFVLSLVQLNRNLIVMCHETDTVKDQATGRSIAGPALQKSLAVELPRYFDEILYAQVKEANRHIWATKPTGIFIARTKCKLPPEVPQDFGIYEHRTNTNSPSTDVAAHQ